MDRRIIVLAIALLAVASGAGARMNPVMLGGWAESSIPESGIPEYSFLYTADHPSGATYAYLASGTTAGTFTGGSESSAQNHTSGGSYSMLMNDTHDRLTFTSPSAYFDGDEGVLEIWVYIDTATMDADQTVFEVLHNDTWDWYPRMFVMVNGNRTVTFLRAINNKDVGVVSSDTITTQSWNVIRIRWSVINNVIGIKINDGSWLNDTDPDSVDTDGGSLDTIYIGRMDSESYNYITYIDDVATKNEYDVSWNGF